MGGGIKRCFCLTSVCLTSVAYIGPNSRTERHRKTKIGTEVAHITRDLGTTFKVKRSKVKVKGQGHQATLLTAALTGEAVAVVTVRTYWAWKTTATLRCARRRYGASAPTEGEEGRGMSWRPPAYSFS